MRAPSDVPLALLGAVLLGARLVDAVADPWIGRWLDVLFTRGAQHVWRAAAGAALLLAVGFAALFFPPQALRLDPARLLVWCAAALIVTYLAYSVVGVAHQAWGARLGGDATQRARIVAWREGPALAGVLIASVLPALAGLGVDRHRIRAAARRGGDRARQRPAPDARQRPRRRRRGIAAAAARQSGIPTPARRLPRQRHRQRDTGDAGAVLRARPAAGGRPGSRCSWPAISPPAALSVPLWVRCVGAPRPGAQLAGRHAAGDRRLRLGRRRSGRATWPAYVAVCVLSGIALGADLALPAALLAGVIRDGRAWRPRRRRLFRLVELRDQAQPRAGCRSGAAAAAVVRLPAGQPRPAGPAGTDRRLQRAAVCAQADSRGAAVAARHPIHFRRDRRAGCRRHDEGRPWR